MPRTKYAPRKRTKKSNKGLTTKEKSQVATIAKKATLSVAEKKFMAPQAAYQIEPNYVNRTSRISVLAFANTVNKVGTGITLQYGSQANPDYNPNDPLSPEDIGVDMRELKMLRPYQNSGINLTTDNYTIEVREKDHDNNLNWNPHIHIAVRRIGKESKIRDNLKAKMKSLPSVYRFDVKLIGDTDIRTQNAVL